MSEPSDKAKAFCASGFSASHLRFDRQLDILLLLTAAVSFGVLMWSFGRPLGDWHSFRQTQTAISVYWMLHGAPWLNYWTPVVGPPWMVPMEFPLYQWIVAALAKAMPVPLDDAGRIISYLWLMAGLLPVARLMKIFRFPPAAFKIFVIIFLASPVYLFWGRSFMIETQALALSLYFLWFACRAVEDWQPIWTLAALIAGIGAALTKITTMPCFFLLAGIVALWACLAAGSWRSRAYILLTASLILLLPIAAFYVWNYHADIVKSANPIAYRFSSGELTTWNFGTWGQRFSLRFITSNLRSVTQMFGYAGVLPVAFLGWQLFHARPDRRAWLTMTALAGLYFLPWMIFSNLYIHHAYYQTANSIFALAAVAFAISWLGENGRVKMSALACGALVLCQYETFARENAVKIATQAEGRGLIVAQILKQTTSPGSAVLIYGLDWSALVPYYAERVARMEPSLDNPGPAPGYRVVPPDTLHRFGNVPVSATVRCLPLEPAIEQGLEASFAIISASAKVVHTEHCDIYFRAPDSESLARSTDTVRGKIPGQSD